MLLFFVALIDSVVLGESLSDGFQLSLPSRLLIEKKHIHKTETIRCQKNKINIVFKQNFNLICICIS